MQSFIQRMIGAAKLQVSTYEEVEHDSSALGQAAAVVLLAALAAGIGALGGGTFGDLVLQAIIALIGWLIAAAIIWVVGTKLLPEPQTEADVGQLLRTLGFAATPGLLRVFGIIPVLGPIVLLVAFVWTLVATVIAVRQALDYNSTGRAVGVVVIAWVVQILIALLFGGAFIMSAGGPTA